MTTEREARVRDKHRIPLEWWRVKPKKKAPELGAVGGVAVALSSCAFPLKVARAVEPYLIQYHAARA